MNKVQDISTPLATVVGRDFMSDSNPIGADQVRESEKNTKRITHNSNPKNKLNLAYTIIT